MDRLKPIIKIVSLSLLFVLLFTFLGLSISLSGISFISPPRAEASALTQPLVNLSIGDRVVDPSWQWEFKTGSGYSGSGETHPVIWTVVAKNHYGSNTGVTLLSEELIGKHSFDNSTNRGHEFGSNNWEHSGNSNATFGLRAWLNSTGSFAGSGFRNAFSDYFNSKLVTVTIPHKFWETGAAFATNDRVFIPSSTELGDTDHTFSYPIGTAFEHFVGANNASRIAQSGDTNWKYWTRSPLWFTAATLRLVGNGGSFEFSTLAYADDPGIRPAVNLQADTAVSLYPTSEGVYKILGDSAEPEREWVRDEAADVDALALAYNSANQLTGAFAGSGVWHYDGSWEQLVGNNAVALSYDGDDNLAAAFPGFGISVYDGEDWTQLAPNDANTLAYKADGGLTANFPGWGVYHYNGAEWEQITGTEASALTYNAAGHLVASFPGSGVFELVAGSWARIAEASASGLASGTNLAGTFPGFGVWVYNTEWSQLTGVDATSLAYNSNDDLAGAFGLFGVWYYVEVE